MEFSRALTSPCLCSWRLLLGHSWVLNLAVTAAPLPCGILSLAASGTQRDVVNQANLFRIKLIPYSLMRSAKEIQKAPPRGFPFQLFANLENLELQIQRRRTIWLGNTMKAEAVKTKAAGKQAEFVTTGHQKSECSVSRRQTGKENIHLE